MRSRERKLRAKVYALKEDLVRIRSERDSALKALSAISRDLGESEAKVIALSEKLENENASRSSGRNASRSAGLKEKENASRSSGRNASRSAGSKKAARKKKASARK